MNKNFQTDNSEFNLIELIQTIWDGKWKVAVAAVMSYIAVIIYQPNTNNNFTAISEIKPISFLETIKYTPFNDLITDDANPISSSKILNLYLDILEDKSIFEDAIRKFNLLEAGQYNNDEEYNKAIIKLASSIKILLPGSAKVENLGTSHHTISIVYDDVEKWKNVLIYINDSANKLARKILVGEYNSTLSSLKNKQNYQLEDILVKINNYLIDYEREIFDHLTYLKEQSEIARKLGIAQSTIAVQTFSSQNTSQLTVKTDSPFYLRGYEAIDKEIELINLRENKKAFIKGLYDLEKVKRTIEQDKTIERTKLALQSILLTDNKKFSAASIDATRTEFQYEESTQMYRKKLAILIGLIVGVFYVIISSALQSHRAIRKKG